MTTFSAPARGFHDCSVIVFMVSARDLVSWAQLLWRCSSRCCFCVRSVGVPNSIVASIARSHGLSVMMVLPLTLHVLTVCAVAVYVVMQAMRAMKAFFMLRRVGWVVVGLGGA